MLAASSVPGCPTDCEELVSSLVAVGILGDDREALPGVWDPVLARVVLGRLASRRVQTERNPHRLPVTTREALHSDAAIFEPDVQARMMILVTGAETQAAIAPGVGPCARQTARRQ